MPCSCCDWGEDVYIKERYRSPHCDTCECRRNEIEVRRKISRQTCPMVPRRIISRCHLPQVVRGCPCETIVDCDRCLCYECRRIRGRSEASICRRDRRKIRDDRHMLLETWFSRFDSDGDGFLDLVDLGLLLKYLGAKMRDSYAKKILKVCDRDSDGRLSFPECAAYHDKDFVKRTGCTDLSHIVKKYNLFPGSPHCSCHDYHCEHVTVASEHPVVEVKCNCGQNGVIPFIKHDDKVHRSPKKPLARVRIEEPERMVRPDDKVKHNKRKVRTEEPERMVRPDDKVKDNKRKVRTEEPERMVRPDDKVKDNKRKVRTEEPERMVRPDDKVKDNKRKVRPDDRVKDNRRAVREEDTAEYPEEQYPTMSMNRDDIAE